MGLGFETGDDLRWMRDRLRSGFGDPGPIVVRTPIGQLVKSMISSRTRDAVSLRAYGRLRKGHAGWSDLAGARVEHIEALIHDVTFPQDKARYLSDALGMIAADHPRFDLGFLGRMPVRQALAWLERLPGVGRKVAASTLNFSTLTMPAFVIDTHVLRIVRRFGLVRAKADTRIAFDAVMARADAWRAGDLAELHVLLKRLGQTICRVDGGVCRDCPLSVRCEAAVSGTRPGLFPVPGRRSQA